MSTKNLEIRMLIESKRLKHYEVAEQIGITANTFSHWLQVDLSEKRKQRILKAISEIK